MVVLYLFSCDDVDVQEFSNFFKSFSSGLGANNIPSRVALDDFSLFIAEMC